MSIDLYIFVDFQMYFVTQSLYLFKKSRENEKCVSTLNALINKGLDNAEAI
jgi:hypothetical protein